MLTQDEIRKLIRLIDNRIREIEQNPVNRQFINLSWQSINELNNIKLKLKKI